MKIKKTIGFVMIAVGLFFAVCTTNESKDELAFRGVGVALFAAGAFLAEAFDFQNVKQ